MHTPIHSAHQTHLTWKQTSIAERERLLLKLAELLMVRKRELAEIVVAEVGTPISQAQSEIEKCALLAQYYEGKLKGCLCEEYVSTTGTVMYYQPEPLGVILGIHPWNFPFWMALRFIIPTVLAGNAVVFKHASLVPRSAAAIHQLFLDAGFPENLVTWLNVKSSEIEPIIADPLIRGVNFAGGVQAGSSVASLAGKYIKKSVLELGGSDAAIVLADADVAKAANELVSARLRNAGQACNSPKRILVHESVYEAFVSAAAEIVKTFIVDNPELPETKLGPLATEHGKSEVTAQVDGSVASGARIVTQSEVKFAPQMSSEGSDRSYPATLIADIKPGMKVWDEEVFGPVVAVGKFSDQDSSGAEAISLANQTTFGLGASIWTANTTQAKQFISQLEVGNVYFNMPVRSDPKLPFGGVKDSGYGRELGRPGLLEFTNLKSVVIV